MSSWKTNKTEYKLCWKCFTEDVTQLVQSIDHQKLCVEPLQKTDTQHVHKPWRLL